MSLVLGLRVVRQLGLLIDCVALRERVDCEAASKKRGCEDHVSFQRANIGLPALVHGLELLDYEIYLIESMLNLVVCITWRQLKLEYEPIKLVKDYDER